LAKQQVIENVYRNWE